MNNNIPAINNLLNEVIKPKEILWIPFSSGILPEENQEVWVSLWIDDSYGKGTDISYEVDLGEFSTLEGYLPVESNGVHYGFMETVNDWNEGQPIKVLAWWPKPISYKEPEQLA